jgi:integrase
LNGRHRARLLPLKSEAPQISIALLTPAQIASPLARRPYDLRHAAASLWLNACVPATEVARRLGHSVAVLLKVYANCIDGGADGMNDKIGGALG